MEYSVASSNIWTCIQGDMNNFSLSRQLTVPNLVIGQTYKFRTKAHNINGWGLLSDSLTIISSSVPDKPLPVDVSLVNQNVEI